MNNHIVVAALAALAMGGLAGSAQAGALPAGNTAAGKAVFAAQCSTCHSAVQGQNGIGPSLYGVAGKAAASTPGFQFSPALKSAHIVWTDAALDKFLKNPQADVPGTKMPYMGMPNAQKRADVIAYLATLGDGK